jgi:hypothetical protein
MLSKTAMALVPAASLVGAAALAPTTSFIAVNYPYCQENAWDSKCRGRPCRPLSPLQKKLNGAG